MTELPATEYAGFLWLSLDPQVPLDVAAHLGPLGDELESWGIGHWSPLGEKVLDSPIKGKLAIDTFAENYHFPTVHRTTFATIARGNCTVFDAFGPHHRLVFPLNGIYDLEGVPEEQWEPLQNMVVIYALFPNIVLSATVANGELFRVYPADVPGRSITVHQNSTPLDITEESVAAGARAVFDYAHATVRDEDYRLVAGLQANLESVCATGWCSAATNPGCSIAIRRGRRQSPNHISNSAGTYHLLPASKRQFVDLHGYPYVVARRAFQVLGFELHK